MARMDDNALLRHLQSNEDDAADYLGQIGHQRVASLREYYREPYPGDTELDGWSQIVTSEVQDTVEWILPELLDIFTASDQAVAFEPTKPEDVKSSAQATAACNYVFYKRNNGFLTLYTAFKDALTVQNCAVMWRKTKETVRDVQMVNGAPPEVMAAIEADGYAIESAEVVQMPDPMTGMPVDLINARVAKLIEREKICVEAFPPEELIIKKGWTSPLLHDCPYVARVMQVTLSDLHEMGFKVTATELSASDDMVSDLESEEYRQARTDGLYNGEDDTIDAEDESQTTGYLRIEYVLVDYDGDGVAERRLIYRLADKILSNEEADHVQIATSSPIINTHRWDGMSIAECVADIQRLKTDMTRNMVNAANLAVNPRKTVLTDNNGSPYADVDDLLDFRIGGIIRTKRADALGMEPTPFNAANILPVMGYIDDMAERRTGVSKQQQGLDANMLRPDRTAAEVRMTSNAAKQRVKLIARIFAETLVKPIFQGIFKLLTDGSMQPIAFQLRGEFVQFDPNEWRDQYDMTINVGLGVGDKGEQIAFFQNLLGLQMSTAQTPFGQAMIDPGKIYATLSKIVELGGQKNVGDFFNDPRNRPPQPQQPNPMLMVEQAKLQQAMQIKQMDMQADQQKFQAQQLLDRQREELAAQAKARELQMQLELQASNDARDAERAQLQSVYEAQLEAQRLELERYKVDRDNETKIITAQIAHPPAPEMPEQPTQQAAPQDQMAGAVQMLAQQMARPKTVIRDDMGRIVGVQ